MAAHLSAHYDAITYSPIMNKTKPQSKTTRCCPGVLSVVKSSVKDLFGKVKRQNATQKGGYNAIIDPNGLTVTTECSSPYANSEYQALSSFECKSGRSASNITISKSAQGFGFTVKGRLPVRVSRVKEGSSAEKAGLMRGDVIKSVNGNSATNLEAPEVARLVRNSETDLILEISRSAKSTSSLYTPLPASRRRKTPIVIKREAIVEIVKNEHTSARTPELTTIEETDSTSGDKNTTTTSKAFTRGMENEDDNDLCDHQRRIYESSICENVVHCLSMEEVPGSWSSTKNTTCAPGDISLPSLQDFTISSESDYDGEEEGDDFGSYASMNCDLSHKFRDTTQTSTSLEELDCLAELLAREANFVEQMRLGMASFSRPLRFHILSPSEHHVLFQNVEKLVVLSERFVDRITEAESDFMVHRLYGEQMHLLCEAYEIYLSGLPTALSLCKKLKGEKKFRLFLDHVYNRDYFMEIETFLEKPVQHLLELVSSIRRLIASHDIHSLRQILDAMLAVFRKSIEKERRFSTSSLDSGIDRSPYSSHMTGHRHHDESDNCVPDHNAFPSPQSESSVHTACSAYLSMDGGVPRYENIKYYPMI